MDGSNTVGTILDPRTGIEYLAKGMSKEWMNVTAVFACAVSILACVTKTRENSYPGQLKVLWL